MIESGTENGGPATSAYFCLSSLPYSETKHYYEVWGYHNSKLWYYFELQLKHQFCCVSQE